MRGGSVIHDSAQYGQRTCNSHDCVEPAILSGTVFWLFIKMEKGFSENNSVYTVGDSCIQFLSEIMLKPLSAIQFLSDSNFHSLGTGRNS